MVEIKQNIYTSSIRKILLVSHTGIFQTREIMKSFNFTKENLMSWKNEEPGVLDLVYLSTRGGGPSLAPR